MTESIQNSSQSPTHPGESQCHLQAWPAEVRPNFCNGYSTVFWAFYSRNARKTDKIWAEAYI